VAAFPSDTQTVALFWEAIIQGGDLLPKNMTIGTREIPPEAARTANPVQTTVIFGVKKEFRGEAIYEGFPLQYEDFPLGRALSSAG
jgi:hypothetical protein